MICDNEQNRSPFDEAFYEVELSDLAPLIAKAMKQNGDTAYLTSTIMKYWAPVSSQLDRCGYCPLDLTVHWNIQGTLVTQLLVCFQRSYNFKIQGRDVRCLDD